MLVSTNWLKKYTDIRLPINDLIKLIGSRLVEIESCSDLGEKYKDALVVGVVDCKKLEKSDHLHVLKIDDGQHTKGLDRDENGLIQVVCGAPNIAAGQKVVWLPPKSVVPSSFNQDDKFILDSRKLLGVLSHGMIASAKELDLYDEHSGILVVDNDINPGTTFCDAYDFDDYILDIENKSLTHRPDCFGVVGFAREVSAIQEIKFITPDWLCKSSDNCKNNENIKITIEDSKLCPRYEMAIIKNVDPSVSSPLWMQFYLARVGIRPINLIVDITNYLMMVTGQPLHAYDYDKLKTSDGSLDIHIRSAKNNETIKLIDSKEISLEDGDIVVACGSKPVALAGAMGGAETAISSDTRSIVIESASFNLYNLRGTQMRHGIFSEAITRFTKGQPAGITDFVLNEACNLMMKYSVSATYDGYSDSYPNKRKKISITTGVSHINDVLGTDISTENIIATLDNAGFSINAKDADSFIVEVPYWRNDIEIREDIDEEIGRIYGFDNIKISLPWRKFTAVNLSEMNSIENDIRHIYRSTGVNEVLTYSFINSELLKKVGQDPANSYKIINSISPDLQYYRQSLLPSLLNLISPNIRSGYNSLAIFEINKTHQKKYGLNDEHVPFEKNNLAFAVADKESNKIAFYKSRRYLDLLLKRFNVEASFDKVYDYDMPECSMMDENRLAAINIEGKCIGFIGEFKNRVRQSLKLPNYCSGFEIDLDKLLDAKNNSKKILYLPISKFPSIERDICIQTENGTYQELYKYLDAEIKKLPEYNISISPIDIYKNEDNHNEVRNITFRMSFTSMDKTLTNEEINQALRMIEDDIVKQAGAKVI